MKHAINNTYVCKHRTKQEVTRVSVLVVKRTDQLEEALGGGVVVAPLVGQVDLAHLVDRAVHKGHELTDRLAHALLKYVRHQIWTYMQSHIHPHSRPRPLSLLAAPSRPLPPSIPATPSQFPSKTLWTTPTLPHNHAPPSLLAVPS